MISRQMLDDFVVFCVPVNQMDGVDVRLEKRRVTPQMLCDTMASAKWTSSRKGMEKKKNLCPLSAYHLRIFSSPSLGHLADCFLSS